MSAHPLVIPRQRIPDALWKAQHAAPNEASPVFQVIAAATFVAIAIRRTAGLTQRATYWATAGRAAFAQRLSADTYGLDELDPGDLGAHAVALVGANAAPYAAPLNSKTLHPKTRHRSELASGTVAGHAIESHWELATVRLTSMGAEHDMLEVLDLGRAGAYRIHGDTWVTLEPLRGASARLLVAQAFLT